MDVKTLFYIGIIFGLIGGIVLTLIFVKARSIFSSSEVRRLRREKKDLEKRLQEKDKYIDEMMGHAEKLAHNFTTQKLSK
jgi:uridine kinase